MKTLQKRIIYTFFGFISLALIAACSDLTSPKQKNVSVEDLLESTEFQSLITAIEELNKPLVKELKQKEVQIIRNKIGSHIDVENKRLKKSSSIDQLVKVMGYKNSKHYQNLFKSVKIWLKKFHLKYPQFKSFDSKKEKNIFKAAVNSKLQINNFEKKSGKDKIASCADSFNDCMESASAALTGGTAGCVAGAVVSLLGGIACQAANLAVYEVRKYNCSVGYDECQQCPTCDSF